MGGISFVLLDKFILRGISQLMVLVIGSHHMAGSRSCCQLLSPLSHVILMLINHRPPDRKGGLHTLRILSVVLFICKGFCDVQVMTNETLGFMM